MVVLTVGNAYLLCIADAARIDAVNATMATSKVSLDQATDSHDAGVSPAAGTCCARRWTAPEREQQSLISATNQLAKDKLMLARAIGLPLEQAIRLTDMEPYASAGQSGSAGGICPGAEEPRQPGVAERASRGGASGRRRRRSRAQLPTARFSGDYGDIGETAGHSHGTFTATGKVEAANPRRSRRPRAKRMWPTRITCRRRTSWPTRSSR